MLLFRISAEVMNCRLSHSALPDQQAVRVRQLALSRKKVFVFTFLHNNYSVVTRLLVAYDVTNQKHISAGG